LQELMKNRVMQRAIEVRTRYRSEIATGYFFS
jgi:hypothetical protein